MIQFELKNVYGVGTPMNIGNNKMSMQINIKVGIIGMPHDEAHMKFFPEWTEVYEWDKNISSAQAEADMITFAQNWVATNFPEVI